MFGGDGKQEMTMVLPVGGGFLALGKSGDDAAAWTSGERDRLGSVTSDALGKSGR